MGMVSWQGLSGETVQAVFPIGNHSVTLIVTDVDGKSSSETITIVVYDPSEPVPWNISPDDGRIGDQFGCSVALSGSMAIIGAYQDDDNGDNSGSAYLFDAATGEQLGKLLPSDGNAWDSFGSAVSVDGGIALIGAEGADTSQSQAGCAYLFDLSTRGQLAKLAANDATYASHFGSAVSISGGLALIGCMNDDEDGIRFGASCLFDIVNHTPLAKITPEDGEANGSFGSVVALEGGVAMVGDDKGGVCLIELPKVFYTVLFDLGWHGVYTGGGELEQDVEYGSSAVAPSVQPEPGWDLADWDADFSLVTSNMTVIMQYSQITNNLIVGSEHGLSDPLSGTNTFVWGTAVDCQVSDVEAVGSAQYVCTGWSGTGSVPGSGAETNVAITLTNDSTIVWNWTTNYWVQVDVSGAGSVNMTNAWIAAGSNLNLKATAETNWLFTGWCGDYTGGYTESSLMLSVTNALNVVAHFSDDADGDGLTNAEERDAGTDPRLADSDRDGLPDSAELDAGTDPLKADFYGVGTKDGLEIMRGTDPLDPESKPPMAMPWLNLLLE